MIEARVATTDDEREAIYRHRYEVYVEELGRYRGVADLDRGRLIDAEDEISTHAYVTDGDHVLASFRTTWGGRGFSNRQVERYALSPFLAELPAEVLGVGERGTVAPAWRGQGLYELMVDKGYQDVGAQRVLMTFGACEPHLLGFYRHLQRPYAERNINHPEAGYLIPLISFDQGLDALEGVAGHPGLPACVQAAHRSTGAVTCRHLTEPDEYLAIVRSWIDATPKSLLAGMATDGLACLLVGSNVIRCAPGDVVVRRFGTAHTLYLLLDGGTTDGRRAGGTIGHSEALGTPHPDRDAVIGDDGAVVLALSERTLATFRCDAPEAAAALARA